MPDILPRQFKPDPLDVYDPELEGQLFFWPDPPMPPMEVHLQECVGGWTVDPSDGVKKPRRMITPFVCVCDA